MWSSAWGEPGNGLGWDSPSSGGRVDGIGEAHVQRVVVLHQGGVVVVEHQVLQAAVQVVGLSEAEASSCAVDDAVLHLPVHTEETEELQSRLLTCYFISK